MRSEDLEEAERALLDEVATALQEVRGGADSAKIEWSQAGSQHSGRLLILTEGQRPTRVSVPDGITTAMARLRAAMVRPGQGAWLSAVITVTADGDATLIPNYTHRPYWNTETTSMLDRPTAAPAPDESRWAADLRRHPRDRAHQLDWLADEGIEGEAAAALRDALNRDGHPIGGVVLPGDTGDAFEGTLDVLRHSPRHYSLQVTDYGQHEFLGEYPSESQACQAAWQYLTAPMPHPTPIPMAELQQRAQAAQPAYADLHRRLQQAGPGGIVTNLAAGVPFDRIGVLDGLYFFGWNTPWPLRSLPESANGPGATQVGLMAAAPVEVQAEIVAPWFDQPGGGIRFRVETKHQGLRDLVRSGVLIRIYPTG